jgi:farnesyl diphosphate synthase
MKGPLATLMNDWATLVRHKIDDFLPADSRQSKIIEAMRYSALSEGKMLRPFLLKTCAGIFNFPAEKCLNASIAIEFIHVYSLIHDDLPVMDDDDYRRGKLSNHKKFDEATAILAGDALQAIAYQILADESTDKDAQIRCELIKILAESSGYQGMVGGQAIDIANAQLKSPKLSLEKILEIHNLKTAKLINAAATMGACLARASRAQSEAIAKYSQNLGLAFQIKDDIDDYEQLLKNKKDTEINNIMNLIGKDEALKYLDKLAIEAKKSLAIFKSSNVKNHNSDCHNFDDKNLQILEDILDAICQIS